MKNLFFIIFLILIFASCSKDITPENKVIDLRTFYDFKTDAFADLGLSAFYDPASNNSRFSIKADFLDGSIDGKMYYNSLSIPVFHDGFLNDYNLNKNSTVGFDSICRNSVGTLARFKAKNFSKISDFEMDIYIPQYITPDLIYDSNQGIKISWNIDSNITSNNVFGVLMHYDDGNDGGILKSYIFDQNAGTGLIPNNDLSTIPFGSRIKLFYTRGNNISKNVDGKLINAIAYTFGSETILKK